MKPYREWLSTMTFEANASIGGSFVSDDIEDYYQTPWDLGLGHLVKFDHDFLGRAALESLVDKPHRRKVWLRWNEEDTARVISSSLHGTPESRAKYLDMPLAVYSGFPYDSVLVGDRHVGLATYTGYTANIGGVCSLAMLDGPQAQDGVEVTLVWGEEDGGSVKGSVEPHVQTTVRATVSTRPLG
jgi:syringate O-demethylase/vanillate/3-O-methylgallate O-demethylase